MRISVYKELFFAECGRVFVVARRAPLILIELQCNATMIIIIAIVNLHVMHINEPIIGILHNHRRNVCTRTPTCDYVHRMGLPQRMV